MTITNIETKGAFYTALDRRIQKQGKDKALARFARFYYSQEPLSELLHKEWDAVLAAVRSGWEFYQQFDGKRARVRVFNPVLAKDGYESTRTVIEVAAPNMQFLLDSIRMELTQRGLALSDVQQCLLSVVRAKGKNLIVEDQNPNETLIHLEIDKVSQTQPLEKGIRQILKLVQRVLRDFAPMRQQLLLWSDDVGASQNTSELEVEQSEFLRWLYANNFTFLGYEEFTLGKNDAKPHMMVNSALGLCRKGMSADELPIRLQNAVGAQLLVTKIPLKSRIHRPAYYDAITIVRPSKPGDKGERLCCRFIGLFTSSVFNTNPRKIPLVRKNIDAVFASGELSVSSQKGRELNRIIEILPREELLLASPDELSQMIVSTFALQERRVVRLLVRQSVDFVSCLVYVPKDTYDTELRRQVQELLHDSLQALDAEFSTLFSESALIRTHFVFRIDPDRPVHLDVLVLEEAINRLTRSWGDELQRVLNDQFDEPTAKKLYTTYGGVFPAGYQAGVTPEVAAEDISFLKQLTPANPLALNLYTTEVDGQACTCFKVFHRGRSLPLSDVIPILENMGAKCIEEHPYELAFNGTRIWIHDFVLAFTGKTKGGLSAVKGLFEDAFKVVWNTGKENDSFNRLVSAAAMNYRQVKVIRAYARYFGQLQSSYSQTFVADCVNNYSEIASELFELFDQRFNPALNRAKADMQVDLRQAAILERIDQVENLGEDRVLRRLLEMVLATQRTNFYQHNAQGDLRDCLAFKLRPTMISEMPRPRPEYEIFIYSARVEGVHLRGGKVARGGLRWSDRSEDYRTEVLGLVKAQQVKNSVIVPVGAKGGFLPKQIPAGASREEVTAEGIACYRIFIQGLLDVTDNLVKGKVVPPVDVVRHDEDDYYLVVAADKGTAAFSDIANEISISNNFWLGDAFASGGSVGYDHKAMGITARGAWISVQQHFRDFGTNLQDTDFTVVGVGDMSGDVFGNGMLMSEHIRLVAAFNHLHIFIDPEPNAATSFTERQRLFDLPRSSWTDYNTKLISKGGGIFNRRAKSIPISADMKKRFDIAESSLTPNQLLIAILKAQVDLLWNGGIGTYVKARNESHLDVGDKANDAIRVNGVELRCRTVGEGGNLGMTQLARVEFNTHGGVCFTDFIDNAGGVNCSDVEVNIKILLNQLLEKGKLTTKSRVKLLSQMTDEVGAIVLDNNYMQAQAIDLISYQAQRRNFEYSRLMSALEDQGRLDRQLEFLPSEDEMVERRAKGRYFTPPEISILTSYVKAGLKEQLAASPILDEPYMLTELHDAFPQVLVEKYAPELAKHRLRREIIATQLTNRMVNHMGMNFVERMAESTGVSSAVIAQAYVGARDIFRFEDRWDELSALDYKVHHQLQKSMMLDLNRLIRRVTRWLIRNRRRSLDLKKEVPVFSKALLSLYGQWDQLLMGNALQEWKTGKERLVSMGVGEDLSGFVAATHHLYAVMGIVEASSRIDQSIEKVASVFFVVGERLHLHWVSKQIHEFQALTQWQALARESLQDDLNWQQLAISQAVLLAAGPNQGADVMVDEWLKDHQSMVDRWLALQSEMRGSGTTDQAVFTVAIRELMDLAQSSNGLKTLY
ncbi:MAG: glutamate dehydrogenase [Candidatus Azotimanducaceae bacterium]|jgi:glutamate dehydrogenase